MSTATADAPARTAHVVLVGNPNSGKTTLFNALTGLRAKTANFPGTTVEHRVARVALGSRGVELVDLPGLYNLSPNTPDERIAYEAVSGELTGRPLPDAVVVVVDAQHLQRSLFLVSQVLELGRPTVLALNMSDLADAAGVRVDTAALAERLGCPVIRTSARSGMGLADLRAALSELLANPRPPRRLDTPAGDSCPFAARHQWAEQVCQACETRPAAQTGEARTARLDRFLTHPLGGMLALAAVMFGLFYLIFSIAEVPMTLIEESFGALGEWVAAHLPDGLLRSLIVDGVIAGIGGVLVFLPQICILFFLLSLLEDTGYLARAAFVMERPMRACGLPGKAFVSLLSAHACAIPAIMSTRVIENWRDRLVTILVLPLATCSARIPVYVMIASLLFGDQPAKAALLFAGGYLLGVLAISAMAFLFKGTILRGETEPLVIELPSYKWPSLRTALLTTWDRARLFIVNAGTVILLLSIVLWWLASFPRHDPSAAALALQAQAEQLTTAGQVDQAAEVAAQADHLIAKEALAHSYAGWLGHAIEPVLRPLGFDWQIGIGVVASFAAREVFVSTMAVVFGVGQEAADDAPRLSELVRNATRSDGSLLFTAPTCVALMVFYVLAMQCMSTLAVVRRETNSWRWPIFQFVYMTVLAWGGAWAAYHVTAAITA